MRQKEIAYLNTLTEKCVMQLDRQVSVAQCPVHENTELKATVTLTVSVAHDDETGLVVTEFKIRAANTHKDPQAIDAVPREGDD